ncbi:MAG: efflux RND transporter periplasmic adaptor subunit [Armatimonadetes bacterium]|nr:efflux RND transporter periplasmic adaptor subunit [Armatimonadota bacterium]
MLVERVRNVRAAVLGTTFLVALAGCAQRSEDTAPRESDQTRGIEAQATTAEVVRRDFTVSLATAGRVLVPAESYAALTAPFRAPVQQVFVAVGQSVEEGDALVQLDYPSAEAYYREASLRLRQARTDLREAEARLEDYPAAARQQLASARAAVSSARESYHRTAALLPNSPDLPALYAHLQTALNARMAAEAQVAEAEAYVDEAVQPYRQRLAAAQESFAAAEQGKRQASIKTPIDGDVLQLNAAVGQVPPTDRPVVVVAELADLFVEAMISAEQAAQVERGMDVAVQVTQVPGETFDGRVTRIAPNPAATRPDRAGAVDSYVVRVSFRNREGLVKPNMTGNLSFELGSAKNTLVVPTAAIAYNDQAQPYVTVQRQGAWRNITVETGLADERLTEIEEGLREGEVVQLKQATATPAR